MTDAAGHRRPPAWSVLQAGADLVLPQLCAGCDRPGVRWCGRCATALTDTPIAVLPRVTIGVDCWALSRYRGPARRAVIAAKEHGRRDVPVVLGVAVAGGVRTLARWGELPDGPRLHLIPAPTRTVAARRRGGDTVTAMARSAATELGIAVDVRPVLVTSMWARDSAGLSARERTRNLADSVRLRRRVRHAQCPDCPACAVILLDDVLTTGATVAESVRVLRRHNLEVGAVVVIAAA